MTQTYDPAAAQANNAARNQEIERAAMPTTKPLTKLADNPDHCRQVWECVTGTAHIGSEEPLSISAHEENNFFGRNKEYVIIQQEFDRITIWSTGNFDFRLDESETSFNPFALVALLTKLGYAPQP